MRRPTPAPNRRGPARPRRRPALGAFAELVRAPAALTVPGDVLAGAAAAGRPLDRRVALTAAGSVCLYWAGMALNDWADREEDARDRPARPIPSGRISPTAALTCACALTAGGLALTALGSGRRALLTRALPLAAAVWTYDLAAKATALGPATMAAARGLDVLLGAGPGGGRRALPAAALMSGHILAVTRLSRSEVHGAGAGVLGEALTASATVALAAGLPRAAPNATARAATAAAAAGYAALCWTAQGRALRDPRAERVRAAVGAGIHAVLPLQAALLSRSGAVGAAVPLAAAVPVAIRLARKVSPT
jgi:4-hydroxybenzoate polyprenyltransferase